jgi:hypothetical protein
MTQNNSSGTTRRIDFGYILAAKLATRQQIIGLYEDEAAANAHRDRLQAYHDSKPDLGDSRHLDVHEIHARRDALEAWKNKHFLGAAREHLERYEVIAVPWMDPLAI